MKMLLTANFKGLTTNAIFVDNPFLNKPKLLIALNYLINIACANFLIKKLFKIHFNLVMLNFER